MGPIRHWLAKKFHHESRSLALLDGDVAVQMLLRLETLLEPLAMAFPALPVRHEANVPLPSGTASLEVTEMVKCLPQRSFEYVHGSHFQWRPTRVDRRASFHQFNCSVVVVYNENWLVNCVEIDYFPYRLKDASASLQNRSRQEHRDLP